MTATHDLSATLPLSLKKRPQLLTPAAISRLVCDHSALLPRAQLMDVPLDLFDNKRFAAALFIYYESETKTLLSDLIQQHLTNEETLIHPETGGIEGISRIFLSLFISLVHDIDPRTEGVLKDDPTAFSICEAVVIANDVHGFEPISQILIAKLHSEVFKGTTVLQSDLLSQFQPLVARVKSMAAAVHEYVARKVCAAGVKNLNATAFKPNDALDDACSRIESIYVLSGTLQKHLDDTTHARITPESANAAAAAASPRSSSMEPPTAAATSAWKWVRTRPVSVSVLLHKLVANLNFAGYARACNYLIIMNDLADSRNMEYLKHQKVFLFEAGVAAAEVRESMLAITQQHTWMKIQEFGNQSISSHIADTAELCHKNMAHFFHITSDTHGVYVVMDVLLAMRFESLQVLGYLKQKRFLTKRMSYAPVLLRFFVSYSERALELNHGIEKWHRHFSEEEREILRKMDDATMQFYAFIGALTNFIDMNRYVGRPDGIDTAARAKAEAETIQLYGLRYGMFAPCEAELFMRYRELYRLTDRIYEAGRGFDAQTPAAQVSEVVGAVAAFLLMKQPHYIPVHILVRVNKYLQKLEREEPQKLATLNASHAAIMRYLSAKMRYALKGETYRAKYQPRVGGFGKKRITAKDCLIQDGLFNGAAQVRIGTDDPEEFERIYVRLDSHGINHHQHRFLYEDGSVTFGAEATPDDDDVECEEFASDATPSLASAETHSSADNCSSQSSAAGSSTRDLLWRSENSRDGVGSQQGGRRHKANKNHLYTRRSHALVINWLLYQFAFSPLVPADLAADILVGMKTRLPDNAYETGGFKLRLNTTRSNTDDACVKPPSERGSKRPLTYLGTSNDTSDGITKIYQGAGAWAQHKSMPLLAIHHTADASAATDLPVNVATLSCETEQRYDFLSMFMVSSPYVRTDTDEEMEIRNLDGARAANLGEFLLQLEWRSYRSACKDTGPAAQRLKTAAHKSTAASAPPVKTRRRSRRPCPWNFDVKLFLSSPNLLNSALALDVAFQRNIVPPLNKPIFQFAMYYQGCSFLVRSTSPQKAANALVAAPTELSPLEALFAKSLYPLPQQAELCVDVRNLWKKITMEIHRAQNLCSRSSFVLENRLKQLCAVRAHVSVHFDTAEQALARYQHPDLSAYMSQRVATYFGAVSNETASVTASTGTNDAEEEEEAVAEEDDCYANDISIAGSDVE